MLTLTAVLMSIGMSMDSFAISMGKGLATKKVTPQKAITVGLWFGLFHAFMPVIGFAIGLSIADIIATYDNWVLFIVFMVLGILLIKDSLFGEEDHHSISDDISYRAMLPLALLVSLDALVVGVTFNVGSASFLENDLLLCATNICAGFFGMYIGSHFGLRFGRIATFVGGVILIANSLMVLIEGIT